MDLDFMVFMFWNWFWIRFWDFGLGRDRILINVNPLNSGTLVMIFCWIRSL